MSSRTTSLYKKHRFPPEIITHAVWLYHRFSLSFREVEELLAERGAIVSYEAVRQWCLTFRSECELFFPHGAHMGFAPSPPGIGKSANSLQLKGKESAPWKIRTSDLQIRSLPLYPD